MDERLTTPGPVAPSKSPVLASGSRFGSYEIVGPVGAGGMGQVYRARDTRLGRDLAIKVLPATSSSSHDLERFKREACSASALNHPNIVTIFELGEVDSTCYIAMELVEGDLLRDLLYGAALPLQKIMSIATQTADGLAKAHDAGIVHRDLKPENLMVSRDGFVKILDFGLAKFTNPSDHSSQDTVASLQTLPGTVVGTVEYMSPEQASGLPLDFRSDQFSFGAVLYELLTRKRPFQRPSKAETLAAILRDTPDPVAALNPHAPAPLCWLVERCLAKRPDDRYASTRDLARDLAIIRTRLTEAPLPYAETRVASLPAQRTVLVGREQEIAAVAELLLRDDAKLVTLTGPGGIGKTRLALQVLNELSPSFPGGAFFAPLGAVRDPNLIALSISQALGLKESTRRGTLDALKDFFAVASARILLALDNFEHLLEAAPTVAELLSSAPRLKILVTSRSPLHIYGEREFPVLPLPLPVLAPSTTLDSLRANPAVALFLDRAAAVKPNFTLTEENAGAVADICIRLDGLPLAIELAAARVKLLSPASMQSRLESRLQLLTGGARDLPQRQQTLRGAIDWSHDLLSSPEQTLFRRLSVFINGCTLDAVEAVCNVKSDLSVDLLDGVASLVDKSLLRQVDHAECDSRFLMLDTIREYGLERLSASGEDFATRQAHAAYFLVLAEEGATGAPDAVHARWFDLFDAEHDNLQAALHWLIRTGNADWGLRLAVALFRFWETRDHLTEGRTALAALLHLESAKPRTNVRARALFAIGVLAAGQGDYDFAYSHYQQSLEIARELSDRWGVAIALNALAVNARDRGDLAVARSLSEEALAVWAQVGDPTAQTQSLSNLANIVKLQGDHALARSLYQRCYSAFEQVGDRAGMAWSLNYQGDLLRCQSDLEGARALYEQSLALFRDMGDLWGIAACLADLGNLAAQRDDHAAAQSIYRESISIFQELGHKRGIARLLECFASSAAAVADAERSMRFAGAAAALRRGLGTPLSPEDQDKLEKSLVTARLALPNAAAAAAWLEGWNMTPDDAVREALAP